MIQSKQNVKNICDQLMSANLSQVVIDLVQEEVEEVLYSDNTTPDKISRLIYLIQLLMEIYNPDFERDIEYLMQLDTALRGWESDATFANKSLGLDPNK